MLKVKVKRGIWSFLPHKFLSSVEILNVDAEISVPL
jgi:hypothetical protein